MKKILFLLTLLCCPFVSIGANMGDPVKYEINSGAEFIELLNDSILNRNNFKGDSIMLLSDIDLTDYSSVAVFNGYLDGNGHSINNQSGPLFNLIAKDGIVRNITWNGNCSISGSNQGIVAQTCNGLIADCNTYASFSQTSYKNIDIVVGGFCAFLNGGVILNSHNFSNCTTCTDEDKTLTITVGAICAEASDGQS